MAEPEALPPGEAEPPVRPMLHFIMQSNQLPLLDQAEGSGDPRRLYLERPPLNRPSFAPLESAWLDRLLSPLERALARVSQLERENDRLERESAQFQEISKIRLEACLKNAASFAERTASLDEREKEVGERERKMIQVGGKLNDWLEQGLLLMPQDFRGILVDEEQ